MESLCPTQNNVWVIWILWCSALVLAYLCKFEANRSYTVRRRGWGVEFGVGVGGVNMLQELRTQEET